MPYERRDGERLYAPGREPLLSSIGLRESTATVCDDCADAGHVPMVADEHGVPGQISPWAWYPWKAGVTCDVCGENC